jgi:hypothetical protein
MRVNTAFTLIFILLTDCSKEELLRKFPHIYRTDSHSNFTIGPPENFTVTLIEREALKRGGEKNRHYPGAVISFYPPENGMYICHL